MMGKIPVTWELVCEGSELVVTSETVQQIPMRYNSTVDKADQLTFINLPSENIRKGMEVHWALTFRHKTSGHLINVIVKRSDPDWRHVNKKLRNWEWKNVKRYINNI